VIDTGRAGILALLWLLLCCEALAQGATPAVSVVRPAGERVAWRGIPADEAAGTQGAMLYPAPHALGLLAAIFTHAAIVQGSREAERKAKQQAADKVLEPYAAVIAEMAPARLLESALGRLEPTVRMADSAAVADGGWIIEMEPVFALAPDQRTIVLDNAMKLYALGQGNTPLFANIVRVVSAPRPEGGSDATMTGEALADESVQMLAHSIEIVVHLAAQGAQSEGASRTQRYRFGDGEKMERGVPLASACNRVVLRTLRDWLMSVPVQPDGIASACAHAYRLAASPASAAATAATKN
jgi:hypothetical protein